MTDPMSLPSDGDKSGGAMGRLLDAFEEAWKQGLVPSIEEFLRQAPVSQRLETLRELIVLDLEYRLKKGELVTLQPYLDRFPELKQPVVWPSIVAAEARVRARLEQAPISSAKQNAPKLGNYFVLEKFPETGQAEVFLAFDSQRHQQVIIKQLKSNADTQAAELFKQEARVLSKLQHPALPLVFSVETHEGRPFIAMEYIPGPNLQAWIEKNLVSPRRLARMLAPIGHVLHAAHQAGIIHRDVKPSNILVDSKSGECKLIDFGLAEDSVVLDLRSGTPSFASPEQAKGDTQTARTDVWGLGGVLFYALTRSPLYLTPLDLNRQYKEDVKAGQFDRAALDSAKKIPRQLKKICLRALTADADRRYDSAEKMAEALERFARRPMVMLGASIAAFILVIGLGVVAATRFDYFSSRVDLPPDGLHIVVTSGGQQHDIEKEGQFYPDSEVNIQATIPPGVNGSLFLLDSDGTLSDPLDRRSADASDRILRYSGRVTGKGTDFIFVCLNRRHVPVKDDFKDMDLLHEAVPNLGPPAVAKVTLDGINMIRWPTDEGRGKGLLAISPPDKLIEAQKRLHDIRTALLIDENGFQGIAISH